MMTISEAQAKVADGIVKVAMGMTETGALTFTVVYEKDEHSFFLTYHAIMRRPELQDAVKKLIIEILNPKGKPNAWQSEKPRQMPQKNKRKKSAES